MQQNLAIGWEKLNVTTDQLVHTGKCILHAVTLNGITTVGDIAIYDGVSNAGTLIGTISARSAVSVSFQGVTFLYDCKMVTGIYIDVTDFVGSATVTWG